MTPDQRHAIARFRGASGDLAALTAVLDIAETKAHAALGLPPVMDDETTLALEVGIDGLLIPGSIEAVKRAVTGYAKRCNPPRKFSVVNSIVDGVVSVTRLPDPEPEVA